MGGERERERPLVSEAAKEAASIERRPRQSKERETERQSVSPRANSAEERERERERRSESALSSGGGGGERRVSGAFQKRIWRSVSGRRSRRRRGRHPRLRDFQTRPKPLFLSPPLWCVLLSPLSPPLSHSLAGQRRG